VRIPLFVSASGILAIIAAGFAVALGVLSATYHRRYVRQWQWTWGALAAYALLAGLALLSVNIPELTPIRRYFALGSITAAWMHLRWLGLGTRDLCNPTALLPAWREWILGGLMLSAGALLFLPVEPQSDASRQIYLVRVSLVAAGWGLAYATSGWRILRQTVVPTALARRTLGYALITYALLRVLEPLSHLLGPSPILTQFLTFGGIPLLVAMGAGMLITLLEVERERAVVESEARDIAERTATANEALLATALASSSDPVLVVDQGGILVAFNNRFREVALSVRGIEPTVGMRVDQLMGTSALPFWRDAFARAMGGESQLQTQPFILAPGEAARPFGIRVTPVRRDGAIIGVLVVAHDMTEEERLRVALARREEWFRSMIENASDIILQLAPDGTIEYASPSIHRLLGHEAAALVGTDAFGFVHPEDSTALRDAMQRAFTSDDTVPTSLPFRARTATGEWAHLEAVSRPYVEAGGAPRLVVAARDVRERRRLESELLSARRLESIGRLAGGVAHDFNNLLTAVEGNLTLMRETLPGDSPLTDNLEEIGQAVQRGAELTRRLLAFARRQLIEPRILALPDQLQNLERLLKRLLGPAVVLEIEVPESLWTIRADPTSLEQIIVNLAVNARDAMPTGGRLRISAQNLMVTAPVRGGDVVTPGEWVRLDVEDTGTGIDESLLGQIFEPFFTTKERSGGTGLGLATVYGAVTQSDGQIRVHSTPGVGTRFSLYFPRVLAPSPAPASTNGGLPRARDGETVLLMEDEASVREVTTKLLARLGYAVLTANDGRAGVDLAREHRGRLDLIVSDLMMPRLGGIEAVTEITRDRPDLPVLFISGFSEEALQRRGGIVEFGRLLQKPFSVQELSAAVREAIDKRATPRA
jgi:PAS domain S-box-containing protein